MFQSTHPRGVRLHSLIYVYLDIQVSIHAPTRGATAVKFYESLDNQGFNPRTHEGCDSTLYKFHSGKRVSIHAPTRGATFIKYDYVYIGIVSIHAPTRGATIWQEQKQFNREVSIHAPTRGATAYSAKYRILIYKSSHFANINQTITFKVIKSLEFL